MTWKLKKRKCKDRRKNWLTEINGNDLVNEMINEATAKL